MILSLAPPRRRRRPSLTPMIDVVFLLLVFFLLAARFGAEGAVGLAAGSGGPDDAAPRLVDVRPGGLSLNGVAMAGPDLLDALARISGDAVVLRARDGASLQDLVSAMELLDAAGHRRLLLAE